MPNTEHHEYAVTGTIGLLVPQANPTVEAEFRLFLPYEAQYATARLTSAALKPKERLRAYLVNAEQTIEDFDHLQPDCYAFACTGSSYILGHARESELISALEAKTQRPFITATQAILNLCQMRQIGTLTLIAPYPSDILVQASLYWSQAGINIRSIIQIDTGKKDTRGIYDLSSANIPPLGEGLETDEAILVSGTGLASIKYLLDAAPHRVLSSNLCLAWAAHNALPRARQEADSNELLNIAAQRLNIDRPHS